MFEPSTTMWDGPLIFDMWFLFVPVGPGWGRRGLSPPQAERSPISRPHTQGDNTSENCTALELPS